MRFRKEDTNEIREKKERRKLEQGKSRKLVTMVGKGQLIIGVVSHILGLDNTGEFDPYCIERIKNAMQMMIEKGFIETIDSEL